jgi:2,4-dienoyl-CoA reductase-like NADH-dependent reductase (Old Yellow Enzyme family)
VSFALKFQFGYLIESLLRDFIHAYFVISLREGFMSVLFEPVQIGDLQLANRVVMAPLTRSRGTGVDHRTPNELMATYYSQRADAGLIISEATAVTPMGVGYARTPGIWSDEQVQGWKKTTNAVHAKGGKIVLQLWHVGRISDPIYLNGQTPVAPSAIAAAGHVSHLRPERPYVTPRALETSEIPGIVEAFRKGAENAKAAGFDGVEIHGANGYLIDQFLQDSTNHRTDHYGGSIENRARLALEITDAVISVWGAGRVGFHIAPRGDGQSMGDSNPAALFTYLASELGKRKIAFLCAREYQGEGFIGDKIKAAFGGAYIANEKFTKESAEALITDGGATAVAFGSKYISNPDLLERFKQGLPLADVHWETVYGATAVGYTDYPAAS